MSFRPEAIRGANGTGGVVDYRLTRQAVVREYRKGRLSQASTCATPTPSCAGRPPAPAPPRRSRARSARRRRSSSSPTPSGPRLPAGGRCVTSAREMAKLARGPHAGRVLRGRGVPRLRLEPPHPRVPRRRLLTASGPRGHGGAGRLAGDARGRHRSRARAQAVVSAPRMAGPTRETSSNRRALRAPARPPHAAAAPARGARASAAVAAGRCGPATRRPRRVPSAPSPGPGSGGDVDPGGGPVGPGSGPGGAGAGRPADPVAGPGPGGRPPRGRGGNGRRPWSRWSRAAAVAARAGPVRAAGGPGDPSSRPEGGPSGERGAARRRKEVGRKRSIIWRLRRPHLPDRPGDAGDARRRRRRRRPHRAARVRRPRRRRPTSAPATSARASARAENAMARLQSDDGNRTNVPLDEVPARRRRRRCWPMEDRDFYEHDGVNPEGIIRAHVPERASAAACSRAARRSPSSTS